jgi:hypothetical protein
VEEYLALEMPEKGAFEKLKKQLFKNNDKVHVADLCNNVVALLNASGFVLPPATDTACTCVNGATTCEVDVDPRILEDEIGNGVPNMSDDDMPMDNSSTHPDLPTPMNNSSLSHLSGSLSLASRGASLGGGDAGNRTLHTTGFQSGDYTRGTEVWKN